MKLADFWLSYAKICAKVANLATLHVYHDLRERCYGAHVIIIRSPQHESRIRSQRIHCFRPGPMTFTTRSPRLGLRSQRWLTKRCYRMSPMRSTRNANLKSLPGTCCAYLPRTRTRWHLRKKPTRMYSSFIRLLLHIPI